MDNKEIKDKVINMPTAILEKEPKTLDCVLKMRKMAQQAIKKQKLSEKDIRKNLGIKRYEK